MHTPIGYSSEVVRGVSGKFRKGLPGQQNSESSGWDNYQLYRYYLFYRVFFKKKKKHKISQQRGVRDPLDNPPDPPMGASGGSRGRVQGLRTPPPPIGPDACLRLKFLHRQERISLFNWLIFF